MANAENLNRVTKLLTIAGCASAIYVAAFFVYRSWADDTVDTRPRGVPGWYFMYPTQSSAERAAYWLFYPCIRIDQIVRDWTELG